MINEFLHNVHLKWFWSGIHRLRERNDERSIADIILRCVTHIAVSRLTHSNVRHKLGLVKNI